MDAATAERALALLRMLGCMDDGCAIDQLDHALETATRAERVGADEGIVVAARFVDEWLQLSFDPTYRRESLRHFEPLVRRVFAHS